MVQINAYADDVVIISGNPKALEEALQEIHNTAQEIGLIIKKKTKYDRK
jgi:DNA-directed RNA polymerase subunit K/omega